MGNRRFSRKRLFEVEKRGQPVDLGAKAGIRDAIVSATQHRQGQEIITEIVLDLGTSKAVIKGGGGANGVIGEATTASAITQLTLAKFGIITEIRAVLLELPSTGCSSVNVVTNTSATAVQDDAMAADVRCGGLNVIGEDKSATFDDHSTLGQDGTAHSLYLTAADGNADTMGGGKIAIYIHGFAVPSDL